MRDDLLYSSHNGFNFELNFYKIFRGCTKFPPRTTPLLALLMLHRCRDQRAKYFLIKRVFETTSETNVVFGPST